MLSIENKIIYLAQNWIIGTLMLQKMFVFQATARLTDMP